MADNLSLLIPDAFTIYSTAYSKIGRIGVKVVELAGKPAQPRLWMELVYATRLFRVIEPSITLNGGGTAIIGIVGDVDTINNLLLKLKRAVNLFTGIAFPTPLTSFVFNFGNGGADPDATYVTVDSEGNLSQSRRMVQGLGISVVDNGAQSTIQIVNTAAPSAVGISMASPVTLDMSGGIEKFFYGTTNITGLTTFVLANAGSARRLLLNFVISGLTPGGSTHDLTFPSTFKSSDGRWLSGQIWRPIEDGEYAAEAVTYDGVNYIISFGDKIS